MMPAFSRGLVLLFSRSLLKESTMRESGGGDKVLYFLVGAGVGTVLGLLFAPKSGRETREIIARTANDSRDYLTTKVSEGKQFIDESKRKVSDDFTSFLD